MICISTHLHNSSTYYTILHDSYRQCLLADDTCIESHCRNMEVEPQLQRSQDIAHWYLKVCHTLYQVYTE